METFRKFLSIQKIDVEKKIVYGVASSGNVDSQNEIVDPEAMKGALPDYMQWANLREMHQPSAVGVVLKADPTEGGECDLAAKVVDAEAWEKVKEGVYKGFSIGGKIIESQIEKVGGKAVRRITKMELHEISLVDRPANPDAKILLWKGTGMDQQEAENVLDLTAEAEQELNKAEGSEGGEVVPADQEIEKQAAASAPAEAVTKPLAALAGQAEEQAPDVNKAAGDAVDASAMSPDEILVALQKWRDEAELAGNMNTVYLMNEACGALARYKARKVGDEAFYLAQGVYDLMKAVSAKDQPAATTSAALAGEQVEKTVAATQAQETAPAGVRAGEQPQAPDVNKAAGENDLAKALADGLGSITKVLSGLVGRVEQLEKQPAEGGPVLRPAAVVNKTMAGQPPAQEQTPPQKLASLQKMLAECVNPFEESRLRELIAHEQMRQIYGLQN
jgi:HK97 family phage prohead protease